MACPLLEPFGGRGRVKSAFAVGMLAKPRATMDVDAVLVIEDQEVVSFLESAEELGLEPRIVAWEETVAE